VENTAIRSWKNFSMPYLGATFRVKDLIVSASAPLVKALAP
jgi:hypothetical protein